MMLMDYWHDVVTDINDPYIRESYRLDGNHADVELVLMIDLLRPQPLLQLMMNLVVVAVALAEVRMLQPLQRRHDVMLRNIVAPKMFHYSLICTIHMKKRKKQNGFKQNIR